MFELFVAAATQVAIAAVVLGAGLPVVFALGIRAMTLAGGAGAEGSPRGVRHPGLRIVGVLCFAIVVVAVILGIPLVVATGFGKELSFEGILPVLVDKG